MQSYSPGTPVVMNFLLEDDSGAPIVPNSYRWRLSDESGAVLQDWQLTNVSNPASLDGVVTITIPAILTTLAAGQVRGARSVDLEITQGSQIFNLTQAVIIRGSTALVVGVNSLVTYLQAALLSEDLSQRTMTGWNGNLSQADRERALTEAYKRLDRMNLKLEIDAQTRVVGWRGDRVVLSDFDTPAKLAGLDADLLAALKRAQVIEASEILRDDPVAMAREEGLMSTSVGESSQFFRTGKPIPKWICPISEAALAEIARWVRISVRIGRS